MLTSDDVRAVPLFSTLAAPDLERLAQTSADMHLDAGELAVAEGDLRETSMPGVFACGGVRLSPVKRVASAVGEGGMAIGVVHQYLQRADRHAFGR